MFCNKCGKQIADSSKFCEFCGVPTSETSNVQKTTDGDPTKERSGVLELVVGLITIIVALYVFFIIISVSTRIDADDDFTMEILTLIGWLIAGIVGIATRKTADKTGAITAGVIFLICAFGHLNYKFIPLISSAVFFYCAFKRNKIT